MRSFAEMLIRKVELGHRPVLGGRKRCWSYLPLAMHPEHMADGVEMRLLMG